MMSPHSLAAHSLAALLSALFEAEYRGLCDSTAAVPAVFRGLA
jgi:hypothetical protein